MAKMTELKERELRERQGCLTDCLAYYFNIHPMKVPLFVRPETERHFVWRYLMEDWLNLRGFESKYIKRKTVPKRGMYLAVGNSTKYKRCTHCVVYVNGKLVFDPQFPSAWNDSRVTHYLRITRIENEQS